MDTAETADEQKRWTGMELLACAVTQLLLVNIAYRIDRQKKVPLLSTSAWAIFLGLLVRLYLCLCLLSIYICACRCVQGTREAIAETV